MRYVNLKVTDEGLTKEQNHRLIQGATQLLVNVPVRTTARGGFLQIPRSEEGVKVD